MVNWVAGEVEIASWVAGRICGGGNNLTFSGKFSFALFPRNLRAASS